MYVNGYGPSVLYQGVGRFIIKGNPCQFVHLSSGCLWENAKDVDELEIPQSPSWYSYTKVEGEKRLGKFALIIRLRMPFDGSGHPRCLITKLSKYSHIIDAQNSLTYVPDLLDATKFLIERNAIGIFHVVNTGSISPCVVARLFKNKDFAVITPQELYDLGFAKAKRSNCTLNNRKLINLGFAMPSVQQRVDEAIGKFYGVNKKEKPRWSIKKELSNYSTGIVAVEYDGTVILNLRPGTIYNQETTQKFVDKLNAANITFDTRGLK